MKFGPRGPAGLAFAIAVLALATTVRADSFGVDNALADSSHHTYCYNDWFFVQGAAGYAMSTSLDAGTDMTVGGPYACASTTDVEWKQNDNMPSVLGKTDCVLWISQQDNICDKHLVLINKSWIDSRCSETVDVHNCRKKTACHEVGHSVGLIHHDDWDDCMTKGPPATDNAIYRTYNSHHTWHIDSYY